MSARRIDLGTVVRTSATTKRYGDWTADGVVIEVVRPQKFPTKIKNRNSLDCATRYVVQTETGRYIRSAANLEIVSL